MGLLLSVLLVSMAIPQEQPVVSEIHVQQDEADPIQPIKVSHHVDEIRAGDKLVERYNYIVYEFENQSGYVWARTYLDEVEAVAIYGPFVDRSRTAQTNAPELEAAVIGYLKRRFSQIDRLNMDASSANAYETIWRRKGTK